VRCDGQEYRALNESRPRHEQNAITRVERTLGQRVVQADEVIARMHVRVCGDFALKCVPKRGGLWYNFGDFGCIDEHRQRDTFVI